MCVSCFVSFIAVVFIGSVDITIFFFGKGGGRREGGREGIARECRLGRR